MSVDLLVDEPIYYYEWDVDHHVVYEAVVRLIPNDGGHPQHPKVHVRLFDESSSGFRNVNNVLNEEIAAPDGDLTGISYWRKRFPDWEP